MKGPFVVYWLIDFNEKHSIVPNVGFQELCVPVTCFQIGFKEGHDDGGRPGCFGITTNKHTHTPRPFIHTHTKCFNPLSLTLQTVLSAIENSKSITEKEEKAIFKVGRGG